MHLIQGPEFCFLSEHIQYVLQYSTSDGDGDGDNDNNTTVT